MALTPEQWSLLNQGIKPDTVNIYDNWVDYDPNINYRDFSRMLRSQGNAPSQAAELFGKPVLKPINNRTFGTDAKGNLDPVQYLYSDDGTRYLYNQIKSPLGVTDYDKALALQQGILSNPTYQGIAANDLPPGTKTVFKGSNSPLDALTALKKGIISAAEMREQAAIDVMGESRPLTEVADLIEELPYANAERNQEIQDILASKGLTRYDGASKYATGTNVLPITEPRGVTTTEYLANAGNAATREAGINAQMQRVEGQRNIYAMPSQLTPPQQQDVMSYVGAYEKDSVPLDTRRTIDRANSLQDTYQESIQSGSLDPLYRRPMSEENALTRDFDLDGRFAQGMQDLQPNGRPQGWGEDVKIVRAARTNLDSLTAQIRNQAPSNAVIRYPDELLRYATGAQRESYAFNRDMLAQSSAAITNASDNEAFNQRVVDGGQIGFKNADGNVVGMAGIIPIKGGTEGQYVPSVPVAQFNDLVEQAQRNGGDIGEFSAYVPGQPNSTTPIMSYTGLTNADYLRVNPLELAAEQARMTGEMYRQEQWGSSADPTRYREQLAREQANQDALMKRAKKTVDYSYIPTTPGRPRQFLAVPPDRSVVSSPEARAVGNLPNSDLRLNEDLDISKLGLTDQELGMLFSPENVARLRQPDTTGVVSVVDQTITDTPIRLPYTVPAFTQLDDFNRDETGKIVWTPEDTPRGSYLDRVDQSVPRQSNDYSTNQTVTVTGKDGQPKNVQRSLRVPGEMTTTEFPSLVSQPPVDNGAWADERFYSSTPPDSLDRLRPIVGGATITSPDNAVIGLFNEDTYDFTDNPVNQNALEYLGDVDRQYGEVRQAIAQTPDGNPLKEVLLEREGALRANRNYLATQLEGRSRATGIPEGQANLTNALRFQEIQRQRAAAATRDYPTSPMSSLIYQQAKNNDLSARTALSNAADELADVNPATERPPNPAYADGLDARAMEYVKATQAAESAWDSTRTQWDDLMYQAGNAALSPAQREQALKQAQDLLPGLPVSDPVAPINDRISRIEQSGLDPDTLGKEIGKLKGFRNELYQQASRQEQDIRNNYIRAQRNAALRREPSRPTGLADIPSNQLTPTPYTALVDNLIAATDGGQLYRPDALPATIRPTLPISQMFPGQPGNPNPMAISTRTSRDAGSLEYKAIPQGDRVIFAPNMGSNTDSVLRGLQQDRDQYLADYLYNSQRAGTIGEDINPAIRASIMDRPGVGDPEYSDNVGAYKPQIGDPPRIPVARLAESTPAPINTATIGGLSNFDDDLVGQAFRRLARIRM